MKKITFLTLLNFFIFGSLEAQDAVTYEQAFPNLSFEYPVEIQNADDDSDRMFVVEQSGRIKVFQNNSTTTSQQTFLDIRNVVSFSSGQEIGLLGLAFHPNYRQNGYFYVYHTRQSSVSNVSVEIVLARYQVSSSDPNRASTSSRLEIFSFDKNQGNSNHNGGKIGFGPDGYLYVSIGDGGGGGDPRRNAQNLNNVFGSILRIDVDVDGSNPLESNPDAPNGNYEIPSDNPRRGQSGLDELYAWGIRNTWKFSWDGNRMWGADVGQSNMEEINIIQRGGNYGWNRFEGTATYNSSSSLATSPDVKPIFTYGRGAGDLSITGGYVYRGSSTNTNIQGKYIYGDYVSGRVWALDYNASTNRATSRLLFRTNGEFVSSFGLDESGELYFSGYGTSAKIFKINGGGAPPPPPGPTTVAVDGVGVWKELENGTNGTVEAVVVNGDDVYVAGSFSNAGGVSANNIAVYNKTTGWQALSSGANGDVKALAVSDDGKVYAGGTFSSMGGVSAQNVAVWNGSSWAALASGTNGSVAKIGIDGNNNVYVGGAFENAGGLSVRNIARWNGSRWSALADSGTSVVGTNNEIRAIAFDSNDVMYIGGNFDNAGGKTANRIATWNGSSWGTLGQGTSGFVQAIEVTSGYVYAGGNFSSANGETVNRIARWNRSTNQWGPLGNGLSGNVNTLDHDGTYLYVGGNFETAGQNASTNYIVKNMARWSSANGWEAMGPSKNVGTNNTINTIALSDSDRLYTGGSFSTVANVSASRLAVWGLSFDCSDERLITEYRIDGDWSSGERELTLEEGTNVILSILPNGVEFSITLPNSEVVNGDYSLGDVTPEDAGTYVFVTENGCETSLVLNIESATGPCNAESVIPEYKLGDGDWIRGDSRITVDEGTRLALSMFPDDKDFTVKLPDGTEVANDYDLGTVSPDEAGIYLFTTEDGCTATFTVNVIEDEEKCPNGGIIPEYRLNRVWYSGETAIVVKEGTDVVLSILPNDVALTITLPDGTIVNDNYSLGLVTTEDSGVYLFTSAEGCAAELDLTVEGQNCDGIIIPEYRINGTWLSGDNVVTVNEGSDVAISMLPNGIGLNITKPDGTIVGDNYRFTSFSAADSGTYTLTSEEGCTETLEFRVTEGCEGTIIPEYRINGEWKSGQNSLTVDAGTNIMLSMLPNDIGLTITKPDGTVVGDNHSLGDVSSSDSGVYTIRSENGCVETIDLNVNSVVNCSEGSLIAEYRVNGEWQSGRNVLTVESGSNIVLSALPNDLSITITLPDGRKVNDNHSLGAVDVGNSGFYIIESSEGCKEVLQLYVTDGNASRTAGFSDFNKSFENLGRATDEIVTYPNPTSDIVNIDLYSLEGKRVDITVTNMQQQQLLFESLGEDHGIDLQLNLGNFNTGTYFVNILSDGKIITKKVVKR